MADLNNCVFVGRLGRDPEVRVLSNGDSSCNASIAVGKKWRDKASNEMKELTTWVSLSFYGKTAELFGKYCVKGSQICVTTEYSSRKYTDKDGAEKFAHEFKVKELQLLGGKPDGAGGGQAPRPAAQAPRPAAKPAQQDMDDDIPF